MKKKKMITCQEGESEHITVRDRTAQQGSPIPNMFVSISRTVLANSAREHLFPTISIILGNQVNVREQLASTSRTVRLFVRYVRLRRLKVL